MVDLRDVVPFDARKPRISVVVPPGLHVGRKAKATIEAELGDLIDDRCHRAIDRMLASNGAVGSVTTSDTIDVGKLWLAVLMAFSNDGDDGVFASVARTRAGAEERRKEMWHAFETEVLPLLRGH
jgi:hypothetical protein